MNKIRIAILLAILTVLLTDCGTTTSNTVVRAITSKPGTDEK